jgi:hypothetical protein
MQHRLLLRLVARDTLEREAAQLSDEWLMPRDGPEVPLIDAALDEDQEVGVVDAMSEKAVQAGDVIIRWVR